MTSRGPRIVEARQQHERAEAHVAVGVLGRASARAGTAIAGLARRTVRAASMRTGKSSVPSLSMAAATWRGLTLRPVAPCVDRRQQDEHAEE